MTSDPAHFKTADIKKRTAQILISITHDVVTREYVRSKLPPGQIRNVGVMQHVRRIQRGDTGRKNVVSVKFQKALYDFERAGWIRRDGLHVVIVNREALHQYVKQDQ